MNSKQPTAFPVRMPPGLREQLEREAAAAGRSTNHEIVDRLIKSTKDGSSLPKSVTDVIQAASETTGKTFDETLMFYLVLGMQASNQRKTLEARLQTEEFKGIAAQQMLSRCAKILIETSLYMSRLTQGPREIETERELAREANAALRDFNNFEMKSAASKLPRGGDT